MVKNSMIKDVKKWILRRVLKRFYRPIVKFEQGVFVELGRYIDTLELTLGCGHKYWQKNGKELDSKGRVCDACMILYWGVVLKWSHERVRRNYGRYCKFAAGIRY